MREAPSAYEHLEAGRARAGVSVNDLWVECISLGMNAPIDRLQGMLNGTRAPSRHEYDVIAHCLNEHLRELGHSDHVPYGDELGLNSLRLFRSH